MILLQPKDRPVQKFLDCHLRAPAWQWQDITTEMAGYHGWDHLRQVWLVEQDTVADDGRRHTERRFFVTNLHVGQLSSSQILWLIRRHWGEDALPWCTVRPAAEVLSLMRMMAYDLVQRARTRSLRPSDAQGHPRPAPAWPSMFRRMKQALRLDLPSVSGAASGLT